MICIKMSSFRALKAIIEQYETDENPVSAILEISLKDTNRTKNTDLRASVRADFTRYIETQLPVFVFAWNGVPKPMVFVQVEQGKMHFYTRQGFSDQIKVAFMKSFQRAVNSNVNQEPWAHNQTGRLSMEFIVSKPLVYLQEHANDVAIESDSDYDDASASD